MPDLIGPKLHPRDTDYGLDPIDYHLVCNDETGKGKLYRGDGTLVKTFPILCQGIYGPDWRDRNADTPPGLYRLGRVYKDYSNAPVNPPYSRARMAYGWYTFDMIEMEQQEKKNGRAGICLHGGGSACGWPGAWAPYQKLHMTHGCIRMHNQDLQAYIFPAYTRSYHSDRYFWVSVYQDAPPNYLDMEP